MVEGGILRGEVDGLGVWFRSTIERQAEISSQDGTNKTHNVEHWSPLIFLHAIAWF